ncbi:hypothetical protein [Flavilitoribacter nigricans]|uniref:Uncharacterized protein n=1 Tax=Flavilitoribacter nigricans (strain ATCC 23147 / DSM 23189 / NBRC 102662 / NCIMB 1420 / SS-2) TaxID=1122177 RepID=A0A2D0N123_FLAN2|nr:hypothetical protein [Flavilitoribacter nigricans]PHN02214.1 hypothetical protein CRP01_33305 [Flavilitoribacter nigricans DSM 23189 = NBRC 102662]
MATTEKNNGTDEFGTPETVNYIHQLYNNWQNAKLQLKKLQGNLSILKNQKQNVGEEFTRIRKERAEAQDSLKAANTALRKVALIVSFFNSRMQQTQLMVNDATVMAQRIFEATEFVNMQGLERVEEIKQRVTAFNKGDKKNDDNEKWSDIFTSKIVDADAMGQAAFTAGVKAVKAAFAAYITNQQINRRTAHYFQKFSAFEKELRDVITRLGKEAALINRRYLVLEAKNESLDLQVDDINTKVQDWEFIVAQTHAEYNAAQQGAEYKYTPATSPAG